MGANDKAPADSPDRIWVAENGPAGNVEPLAFKRGAIGMIDALGFKGIWGSATAPSLDAWNTLRDAQAGAAKLSSRWAVIFRKADKGLPEEVVERIAGASIDVRLLSDTLVIAASAPELPARPMQKIVDQHLSVLVCISVCQAIQTAATATLPIAFRGAISVGQFLVDGNLLLGPAVDQAAEFMQMPDGAFSLLVPGSPKPLKALRDNGGICWHRVPLLDGRHLGAWTVNPYLFCDSDERSKIRKGLRQAMKSDRLDVVIKRQSTLKFLERLELIVGLDERAKARDEAQQKPDT